MTDREPVWEGEVPEAYPDREKAERFRVRFDLDEKTGEFEFAVEQVGGVATPEAAKAAARKAFAWFKGEAMRWLRGEPMQPWKGAKGPDDAPRR